VRRFAVRPLVFRTIILLVVVNAAAGIAVIVGGSGQLGDTESNVLETTALLSLATLLCLPCVLAHEAGRPKPFTLLPSLAVSCLLIGTALGVYLAWDEAFSGDTDTRIAWSFGIAGVGLAHVCLLSLVRMQRRVVWLQLLAALLTAALAAMVISSIWTDIDEGGIEDWKWRAFIVAAILTAATSLLVPVTEHMLRSRVEPLGTPQRATYCPNCGAVLHMEEPRCLACGVRFRIEFLDA
jgi:hypothetical protein